ncbi:hypothetical protein ACFQ1B_02715 [Streptomyces mexicanus]
MLAGLADPGLSEEPFCAERAGQWLGSGEDAAEAALEALLDAALLELAGLDDQGRPLYRCHELVRLLAAALDGPVRPALRASR